MSSNAIQNSFKNFSIQTPRAYRNLGILSFGLFLFLCSNISSAQSLEEIKAQELATREEMLQISKELGVTCTTCHLTKNYKDNAKKAFKVALDHMRAVELLKDQGFDGKKYEEATCYFCHRGNLRPNMTPPKSLSNPSKTSDH